VAEPIQFFFDEHVLAAVARQLRQRGIDVKTAQEAGRCRLPDVDQLAFATSEDRVLMTFDSDFLALHQLGVAHAGIAWCHAQKYSIGELVKSLEILHGVMDRDSMRNHVEYL
jgi:predicted nuclease of predicted toxin-antitoxin system